jgi:Flp pilus assembly protein TadD
LSILVQSGEDDVVERRAQALLELAATLEPRLATQLKPDILTTLGYLAYLRGALEDARATAREARELGASTLQRHGFGSREVLARVALAQARPDEAKEWLAEAWQRLGPHPMRGSFCLAAEKLSCLTLMAEVAALQGDEREAERQFREALSLAREWGYYLLPSRRSSASPGCSCIGSTTNAPSSSSASPPPIPPARG